MRDGPDAVNLSLIAAFLHRPHAQVSLEGARHAVAWSGINAFNGCGFDLVWASGRTWSLLCDDPLSRKLWVSSIMGRFGDRRIVSGRNNATRRPLLTPSH